MAIIEKYFNDFFRDLTTFGGGYFLIILITILFILKQFYLSYLLFFGFISSYLVSFIIRLFYFKNRPNKEVYSNILTKVDASTFPSVHSTRIVFIALVFSNFFANNILTVLFIIIALITCYSRFYIKKHYYIDIIAGFILGIILYFIGLKLI